MRLLILLPLMLSAAACDTTDDTTGVTEDEAQRLNAAAETLDLNATAPDGAASPQAEE